MAGHPNVNAETRERVWAAARALDFEPNQMARSLRTRSSRLVGMVLPDVGVAAYASALGGAQSVLEEAGYQVMAMNTARSPEREQAALRTLYARNVDGVSGRHLRRLRRGRRPGRVLRPRAGRPRARLHHGRQPRRASVTLVRHLVEVHGHRDIAYIGAPLEASPGGVRLEHGSAAERLEAFRHVMGTLRLPVVPEYVVTGDHGWSAASAGQAVRALMELAEPPTAILAGSDTLAIGALRELRAMGRDVPGDVALVGFDDPLDGDLLDPPMTALGRHYRDLGEIAAGVLLDALRNGHGGDPVEIRVPLELVVRTSCGC